MYGDYVKRIKMLKDIENYGKKGEIIEICNVHADDKIREGDAILIKDLGSRLRNYKTVGTIGTGQIIDKLLMDDLIKIKNHRLFVTKKFEKIVEKEMEKRRKEIKRKMNP